MSGARLTRRVTVEGGKKLPDAAAVPSSSSGSSSAPAQRRLSVFERLGPGAVDRSKPRESYPVERCRNWLREGRCQFGPNCKFLHGPFTDPAKRTKTVRSVVSKDRSSDKEEGHHQSRPRSVDSLEAAEDEELQPTAPVQKKKHKSGEGTQAKKTSKRQRAEQDDVEGEDREGEERKRKKKAKKKREISPMVITKPRSPQEQEESWPDWEENEFEAEAEERGNGSELEWEEQGELDFQRQLALEKRRQDLQRQLAQMDEEEEEEASVDVPDVSVRSAKKDREGQRSVPVVHSRLHPEASSLSPADEAVSSQTAPKKKKKKVDPDAKRAKHKHPSSKERKRKSPRLSAGSVEPETREVSETAAAKGKSNTHVAPRGEEEEEDGHVRESRAVERTPKRITKSHEKHKEGRSVSRDQHRSPPPALETAARQGPRTPPRSDDVKEATDRATHGCEESKNRTRRKAALSPHEAHAAHSHHDSGGERTRRSREGPGGATRRTPRGIQETSEEMHKQRRDKTDKARKVSAGEGRNKEDHEETRLVEETPTESRDRSRRHIEGGSGVSGPRTPSPEHSPIRGPRTPPSPEGPEERHHHGEDSLASKHGPHTPPGEPSFEGERYVREEGPSRHHRGPRSPPDSDRFLSPRDAPRWKKEEAEDFRDEHAPIDRRSDHRGDPHKLRPGTPDDITRDRSRAEADPRRRARDSDPHQRARAHDGRPREEPRHDEREDEHQRARPRAEPRDDDYHRRRDERDDEFYRGRGREEREVGHGRGRARDLPRRQLDGGVERRWDGRDRDPRFPPQLDSRSRDRSGERLRDRDPRCAPLGPDLHRRPSSPPPPPGGRRSPPHGRGRGRPGQPRFDERRRSLSPGRRDEVFRGPPREPSYGRGRETARGYSGPGDSRRPMENRRRGSPPPRQFQDRDRGGPRPREPLPGRGRGIRSFPDRPRPPGDRYREPPREGGASWERRPEREHPRDRARPYDESRDRERRPHGEHSPARGPRHWEEKRGSPGQGPTPPRERRTAHDQEREPKERNVEHGRRSADEEEWEYEEGDEKQARKRPRDQPSPVSSSESAVETKKARSLSPPDIQAKEEKEGEETEGKASETTETAKASPGKVGKKVKKKKEAKKEAEKITEKTAETPAPVDTTAADDTTPKTETTPAVETPVKNEKKNKKEKGKTKEKGAKKKKKAVDAPSSAEVPEVTPKSAEASSEIPSESIGEQSQPPEVKPMVKTPKKRKHGTEGEEAKVKEGEKPTKKKKKKKQHQQEVLFQPWADLEEHEAEERRKSPDEEDKESADREPAGQAAAEEKTEQTGEETAIKRVDEVFSDWSDDDSPLGGDAWFNESNSEQAAGKPAVQQGGSQARAAIPPQTPAFDDVYDPISDDELDAMLEEEDAEEWAGSTKTPAPMSVEEVDWSALVTSHSSTSKTEGHEPGAHLKRFSPGQVFSRIGISPTLAGPRLTKLVQQACAEAGTAVFDSADSNVLEEAAEETHTRKGAGALVAAAAARRRERETLFTDVGPCRRALCARRDLAIRKKLRMVSSKFVAKLNMFSATTTPVDGDLFLMSVALYKHEAQAADVKLVPSKVGSVLASTS